MYSIRWTNNEKVRREGANDGKYEMQIKGLDDEKKLFGYIICYDNIFIWM